MAIVVNGVARFAINATYIDRPHVNVLDCFVDTTGSTANRAEEIYAQAGNIINAYVDNVLDHLDNAFTFNSVSWVDLDEEDGTTGMRVSTSENTLPLNGGQTGAENPGNLAALVSKQTMSTRGSRNGRMYQGGLVDAVNSGNTLTPTALNALQGAFDGFLEDFNTNPLVPLGPDRRMVVVHTTPTDPKFGTSTTVDDLVVQGRLATQRRRLRA